MIENSLDEVQAKFDVISNAYPIRPLGDFLIRIEAGKSYKCDERPPKENEVGIIKVSAVTWGEFSEEESKTILSEEYFREEFLIREEDFLFSRANTIDLIGACVIVKSFSKKLMLSDKTLRFVLSPDLLKPYLLYYLRSKAGKREIRALSTGNQESMRNIGQQRIKQIQIPVPPLPQQQAIVAKIEELCSALDKGKQQLEEVRQQLKLYRQAVLKWAFEGKLTNGTVCEGKLPEGWETVIVDEVAKSYGGYAFKSGEFKNEGKYQVLRMGNVRPGLIRYDESPVYLNQVDDKVLEKALLKLNDVIITQTGTRQKRDYGFTAMISTDNLLLNQRIAAIRFHELYSPKFFLYFSWTDSFKNQFFANETGNVGQGNVGMKAVNQTVIPFPPLEEQHKVVQEIESRLSVCDKMEETIEQSLLQADTLRQSILKRAFEGKLSK